ncbi:MAG: hypothetical protein OEL89_04070 [Candidatus Peregrinibacteria bacterium]|nr:hypothetical protein [Candidatus Peregrinibacteria bacterium]
MSNDNDQSFLNEAQQFGKASGKVGIENLDEAIKNVAKIIPDDAEDLKKSEEDWETVTMKIYCIDCREIVPAGVGRTLRGRPRPVCGKCNSKKISKGREEALVRFYHLDNKLPVKDQKPVRKLGKDAKKEVAKK